MAAPSTTNSRIVAAYRERTPGSAALAETARELFPSGVTHDGRNLDPYGIYVERAKGAHKWDVDGNQYVDYFGGHGALLLGHNHPEVIAATADALALGTHFGANHASEVAWAQAIQRLVPSAERVRFTSSGTEATLMALRLARAFTGREMLVRFKGHFHGWHDHMAAGYSNHFDGSPTTGVIPGITDKTILLEAGDVDALRACLTGRKDIAAVIIEPTGASFGTLPVKPEFLAAMRELTAKSGALLIFDEVVTGFRVSKGGAQVAFDITPDLSSFAKIVAGGLPGAAVAGRRDILDLLDFKASAAAGREKIQHPGTYNGNPVSAAAGRATLDIIGRTDACAKASATAQSLREALNAVLAEEQVPWAVHGTFSGFHLFMNPNHRPIAPLAFDPYSVPMDELKQVGPSAGKLRLALLAHGVDVNGRITGLVSSAHDEADVRTTVDAFRAAVRMMRAEGELPV